MDQLAGPIGVVLIVGEEQLRLGVRRTLVVVVAVVGVVVVAAVGSIHHNQQFVHSPELCDSCLPV